MGHFILFVLVASMVIHLVSWVFQKDLRRAAKTFGKKAGELKVRADRAYPNSIISEMVEEYRKASTPASTPEKKEGPKEESRKYFNDPWTGLPITEGEYVQLAGEDCQTLLQKGHYKVCEKCNCVNSRKKKRGERIVFVKVTCNCKE